MQWRYFTLCFVVIISDLTFIRAQYDEYEYPDDDYETDPDPCITGLTVNGTSGTIQSQDYPSQYLGYENCNWTIRVEDGMRIAVKFSLKFSIETNEVGGCNDVLALNNNGEIRQLCGTQTPDSFVSSTNELYINFRTNEAIQEAGFSFNWTAIDPATLPTRPDNNVSDDEGMISSPNYPNFYGNYESAVWRITVTSSRYIHVSFDSTFGMESGNNGACPYDSLKIYEGNNIQLTKLQRTICSRPTEAIVFKTNQITLHFSTDSTVEELGFSLAYKTINPVECGSPILLSGTMGTVTSPYYPISYDDNFDCTWHISVPEGQRIAVRFNSPFNIKLEGTCSSDMLQLFDGAATTSQQYLEDFCGSNTPGGFLTTTNKLTAVFKSGSITGKAMGFSFNWTAEAECLTSQFQCWDGSCVDLSTKCDGKIDCPNDSADEVECVSDPSLATCGIQSAAPEFFWEHRIIGGSYAKQGSWPWQVSLTTSGSSFCGGVLISDEWVLSAAHCYIKGNNITAILGDHNITDVDATREQRIAIDQVVIHSGYSHSSLQGLFNGSDLALLHLSTPVVRTEWVQPICLPNSPISEGETIVTIGWGRASELSSQGSDVLRQTRLLPTSESQCEKSFGLISSIAYPSGILCLTSPGPGMGPCQGDSGSPAMRVKDQKWEVIGIVSFSSQCGATGLPSYFTDVLAFSSYISKYSSGGKQEAEQEQYVINDEVGTLSVPSSDDDSPNYPQLILRRWFISVPENKRITIRFSNTFNIEFGEEFCPYDYLVIYDGLTTNSEMYLNKKICGSRPPPDFETSSNGVIIEFYSDASYEETGFSISWSTNDDCKADQFRCGDRSCISASLRCDGNVDCGDGMDEITCKQTSTASNQCGVQEVAPEVSWYPLIAGGSNSVEGSWPWQAALYEADSGVFVCGATLVDNRWALTAASCISRTKSYKVSLGDYDIGYASMNEQRNNVQEVTRYLTYNGPGEGDIAILQLEESVTYTDWIKPICLPSSSDSNKPAPGTTCMLTGWGATAVGSGLSGPRILQQVPFTVMSGAECLASFQNLSPNSFATTLPSNLICAGRVDKRTTACMRDTGGPLQCLVDGAWVQYGVLTLGDTCDDLAFFERVSDYEGWIEESIARKQCDGLQILEEISGSIEAPAIDGTYLTMLNCSWLIRAQPGMLLEISFDYFDVESHATCDYDRLLVYDGGNQNSRLYMDEILCGKNTTITGFESTSNEVLVLFITDSSSNFAGFKLKWKAVASCQSNQFRCGDGSCIDISKQCDGRADCSDSKDEVECTHSTNVCGKQYVAPEFLWSSRIYGGSYAKKGSWPWQAYIIDAGEVHQCGATILSEEWILTAAHCTYLRPYFSVGVGGYDQTNKEQDQVIQIDINRDVLRHPSYNNDAIENGFDLALIKLPTRITLNNYTQPICLPTSNVNPISPTSNCVATGWGLTKIDSISTKILRQVRLPPVNSYEICEKANRGAYDEDILFCSGVQGGRDTCRGDSGGPIVCFDDNNWYQYGIVSYGTDGLYCGRAGGVGFYTTVSYFTDWIKNVTNTTFPEPAPSPTSTQTASVSTVSVGLNTTGVTEVESSTAGQSTATTAPMSTTSGSVNFNPNFYHCKSIARILIYYIFCYKFLLFF